MSPVLRVGTNLRIGRLLDGDYLRLGTILRPGTLLAAIPLRFGDIPPSLGLSSAAPRQASPRMAGVSRSGGKAEVRRRRPFSIRSAVGRSGLGRGRCRKAARARALPTPVPGGRGVGLPVSGRRGICAVRDPGYPGPAGGWQACAPDCGSHAVAQLLTRVVPRVVRCH